MDAVVWSVVIAVGIIFPLLLIGQLLAGRRPPKPPKPPREWTKPAEPAVWPRWDGARKRVAAQDQSAWDRDFAAAVKAASWSPPKGR